MCKQHEKLKEIRCSECNSLLAKGTFIELEIMCKCGLLNTFESKNIRTAFTKEELQLDLLKYGMSMKSSSWFIEKYKLLG